MFSCFLRVGCTASACKAKPCGKLCAKRHHVSLHFLKQNTNFLTNQNKSNASPASVNRVKQSPMHECSILPPPPEEVSEKDSNAVFAINQHIEGKYLRF
ncbi:hypothetical protein TNIN_71211 [Trichonephila inaurata madagascariensis]|uniref:Uncharacterized protein n=1 Tax=Trichonephila inaurata madagascariensis TaxID=2747483 RepID=A0A8X7CH64_9ARAC|nr:hypothetical protein TNIN_71211 [Trichonephila inaurata madagascariensis]